MTDGTVLTHSGVMDLSINIAENLNGDSDSGQTSIETHMDLEQRSLILAREGAESFEVVALLEGEGTTTVLSSGLTITQDLTLPDEDAPTVYSPIMVFADGRPLTGRTGAPSWFERAPSALSVLTDFGPILGSDPVDVGDSWIVELDDPLFGTFLLEGSVTSEIETDSGLVFELTLTAAPAELPRSVSGSQMLGTAALPGSVGLVQQIAQSEFFGSVEFTFTDVRVDATALFDPSSGRAIEYGYDLTLEYSLSAVVEDESLEVDYALEISGLLELVSSAPASDADVSDILGQYDLNPFYLASTALPVLSSYSRGPMDEGSRAAVIDKLSVTRGDLMAGGDFVRLTNEAGDSVDVVVITNGGGLRGNPFVMEALSAFWSREVPTEVEVGGRPAFWSTVEGQEWLVWNSDTHVYIVIGPRDPAEAAMAEIMSGIRPYLWKQGDCLDFSAYDGDRPHSPFGLYGLRHCAGDHQYEMLHSEVLPEPFGADFPADIGNRVDEACVTRFVEATGGTPPVASGLGLTRYRPDEDEWRRGARYLGCLVFINDRGNPATIRERIDLSDESYAHHLRVGVCTDVNAPIDCEEPHTHEIVSIEEYDAPPGAARPDDRAALLAELTANCEGPAAAYGTTAGPLPTEVGVFTDLPSGWDQGLRTYYCVVFAVDEEGRAVRVEGSFTGDWREAAVRSDS